MGSQQNIDLAYIAGFLDGDGSIMLQVKKRSDTSRGYRFMATICFYQDTRHDIHLYWIRDILQCGYISKRKDGMTELRINGVRTINALLKELQPFIRFKQIQTIAMIGATSILEKDMKLLSQEDILNVVDLILIIQNENYSTRKKRTKEDFLKIFGLTP